MIASTSLLTRSLNPLETLSASKLFMSTISCSIVRPATPPALLISCDREARASLHLLGVGRCVDQPDRPSRSRSAGSCPRRSDRRAVVGAGSSPGGAGAGAAPSSSLPPQAARMPASARPPMPGARHAAEELPAADASASGLIRVHLVSPHSSSTPFSPPRQRFQPLRRREAQRLASPCRLTITPCPGDSSGFRAR